VKSAQFLFFLQYNSVLLILNVTLMQYDMVQKDELQRSKFTRSQFACVLRSTRSTY
jgi:hypothetical protein